ncbi:MAG: hypothetical protein HZB14_04020 [Actinobacteria bacterium]|nr:hypothetical protein [Actinomycetota bacterium]
MKLDRIDIAGPAFGNLFHVTAHAVGRDQLFREQVDKREFLDRFRNYLDTDRILDSSRHPYPKLHDQVSLVTFGLIDNHFHLILEQLMQGGIGNLMKRTQTAYARFHNDKYDRRGPLFDAPFHPTPLADRNHARRAIAYVHLNHVVEQLDYPFTGHRLFTGEDRAQWINSEAGLKIFGSVEQYKAYLNLEGPAIIDRKLQKAGLCRQTYRYRAIR